MTASRTTSRTTAAAPADFNVVAELGDVGDVGLLADADWAHTVLDTLRPTPSWTPCGPTGPCWGAAPTGASR